jgi:hypothetical protein
MSTPRDESGYRHLTQQDRDEEESSRLAAIRRIRGDELDRLDAQLGNYELERANAKVQIRQFCEQFGSSHVAEWVLQTAKSLGHGL